jgi:hypothetical protein
MRQFRGRPPAWNHKAKSRTSERIQRCRGKGLALTPPFTPPGIPSTAALATHVSSLFEPLPYRAALSELGKALDLAEFGADCFSIAEDDEARQSVGTGHGT